MKASLRRTISPSPLSRSDDLFASIPIPAMLIDVETRRYLNVNDAAIAAYGYSRDEFLAMRADDIRPEEDVPALLEAVNGSYPDWTRSGPWRHRTRDGSLIFVDVLVRRVMVDGRACNIIAAIDISQRKRAEDAARVSEDRFRMLAESARDLIFRFKPFPEPHFDYVSPSAEQILGFTPEQLYADALLGFRRVHPDDLALVAPALSGQTNGTEGATFRLQKPDGTWIWVESRSIRRSEEDGTVTIEGILRDVTTHKAAEEAVQQALEGEREVAERLRKLDEVKNTFLMAVSHELRTPLAIVLGLAATLQERAADISADERTFMLGRLRARGQQLNDLLCEILDVDRLTRGAIEPTRQRTHLRSLISRALGTMERGNRKVHLHADDVVADIDVGLVHRMLENVLSNIARYTSDDANVWISLTEQDGRARISIADDGPGISDEIKEHLFEPFHHTRPVRQDSPGLGIGLSLVAGFARAHGGSIAVADRPGGGTVMTIELPVEGDSSAT